MILKNKQGQMAVFVVLIFQVLFILFAMTINVSIIVHDKINLQNSMDLAVFYGAKKQAEVLNAMAHINYQMRQNWKLLAWRYRILGTLTQIEGGRRDLKYWCPQGQGQTEICNGNGSSSYPNPYQDTKYFTCLSADVWKRGIKPSGQKLCDHEGTVIPNPQVVPVISPFSWAAQAGKRSRIITDAVRDSCTSTGALNWIMVQMFLSHFRLDQKDRKVMLREIYNRTLKEGRDLDGQLIFDGAKTVFFNNLTQKNKDSIGKIEAIENSLKEFSPFRGKSFQEIFKSFNVWPILQYADFEGKNNHSCKIEINPHYQFRGSIANLVTVNSKLGRHPLQGFILDPNPKNLFNLNQGFNLKENSNTPMLSLSHGFYKKAEEVSYYALKVQMDYGSKWQLFSLLLEKGMEFKASAFAKAFGGRFGPSKDQKDPLIPVNEEITTPSKQISSLQPNYSRWPGDKWGLIARKLHDWPHQINFLNKISNWGKDQQYVYTMESFFHLIFGDYVDDPLARPPLLDPNRIDPMSFMRVMELMAVYPDVYDLAYYSISSNYMESYFPKICKLLKGSACDPKKRNSISGVATNAYLRGDFGWPEQQIYLEKNKALGRSISVAPYFLKEGSSIKIEEIKLTPPSEGRSKLFPIKDSRFPQSGLTPAKIFYPWLAQEIPNDLLSSWTPTTHKNRYEKYTFPENFLNCNAQGFAIEGKAIPSSCAWGGRSDYSVKLISCDTVKKFKTKPAALREYCP